ncbi:MAG: tRNA guanosine(34) transglycosylase Tgt [Candidatus ainarchaeum sp.]|nr:tRNA guanosine(34) transglycosylase Tgt [Candidatus ainarchaeum sp.]
MSCFEIISNDSFARTGLLNTAHGKVMTPFFMPVATKGAVKNINNFQLQELGFDCIISNAFISYLKPGLSVIDNAGGLHKFMSWDKSLFTDSGGFQLILDQFIHNISNKGVTFKNPFDKSIELVSPEKAVLIQNSLGSDVAMCLDHQPLFGKSRTDYLDSAIRTIEWAKRCKEAHYSNENKINKNQLLFSIAQGGIHKDIRQKCALALHKIGFDAVALGGFGIGEAQKDMYSIIRSVKKVLPENNFTYIMGIGSPLELINAVSNGADCFDSNYPMRMARHGKIFTSNGSIDIGKTKFKSDFNPLDNNCNCFVCKNYSRSYLHHLFKTYEQNAHIFLTYHNLFFISGLFKNIRISINENNFNNFKKNFVLNYGGKK